MTRKELKRKITRRKRTLNFLLLFFKRTNPLIVSLSQNLDYYIVKEQEILCKRAKTKASKNYKNSLGKVA
ncbi:MAG: hypothetical protein ACRDD2_06225 [Sarcina sp.]